MIVRWILVGLASAVTLVLGATAQSAQDAPSIAVGLHTIFLGETASDAVKALSSDYNLAVVDSQIPKTDKWLLSPKGSPNIPPGTLYARNGRVSGFSWQIEPYDKSSAQNAFNFFFSLIDKLAKENRNHCVLTSGTNFLNGPMSMNKAFVDFVCGPYNFYLLKNEWQDKDSGTVTGFLVVENIGDVD